MPRIIGEYYFGDATNDPREEQRGHKQRHRPEDEFLPGVEPPDFRTAPNARGTAPRPPGPRLPLRGKAPGEDPATRRCRPVSAQLREPVELLPCLHESRAGSVLEIG